MWSFQSFQILSPITLLMICFVFLPFFHYLLMCFNENSIKLPLSYKFIVRIYVWVL
ncbi:hypothetical protein AtNW77_Chr2g0228231 [Arabidopsis thaliana]